MVLSFCPFVRGTHMKKVVKIGNIYNIYMSIITMFCPFVLLSAGRVCVCAYV